MNSNRDLTNYDKEILTRRILGVHYADPGLLRRFVPEIADLLDELGQSPALPAGDSGLTSLTAGERSFHQEELKQALKRYRNLTTEEAVAALEHGATILAEDDFKPKPDLREDVLKLVRKATGIRPRKSGKPAECVVGEGNISRVIPVVRGIDLHLTWEFKLVKVTLDPEQCRIFDQLTSFVGSGSDFEGATDVAENHDDYFIEAIENG